MSEIKFHKANALPSPLTEADDGIWFTEGMGGSFKTYIVSGGVAVPLEVEGYVDLISPQHIDGSKTFNNIGLKLQDFFHVPQANGDALIYHLEYINGRNGLQIIANKDSNLKSMYLDISDLQITGTDLRVQYLELSAKVQGTRNLEGEAVNYLGWKKVFDITSYQIDLKPDHVTTITLSSGNL